MGIAVRVGFLGEEILAWTIKGGLCLPALFQE